eukprot:gene9345-4708_t
MGSLDVAFGDRLALAECLAPRLPIAREGMVPSDRPLFMAPVDSLWRPAGGTRFRVAAGVRSVPPAWFDAERRGGLLALDVATDARDRPSLAGLRRRGGPPRWQYMDSVVAYLRGHGQAADPDAAFPPGLGPRGGQDAMDLAAALFGEDGRAGAVDGPGFRSYVVVHLIAPARSCRDVGPRRDEFDAIKRHGAVAEILIVTAHVGRKVVATPFLHVLGDDMSPSPPLDVDSPFDWVRPDEGLPSAFCLLVAWDFLLNAQLCVVSARVGGTSANIAAWMSSRPSLFRDGGTSRPTLGDLYHRRGDHGDFLRALVFEAAVYARRRLEHPGRGAPAAAVEAFEEATVLRSLADGIPGPRLPERLGRRQIRVFGTLLHRHGVPHCPACVIDCGLHGWSSRRRGRGMIFLSGPVRRVWSDMDAAGRVSSGGLPEAEAVRRSLCEGNELGHGAFCVCAGWALSAMIAGDIAVGEMLEL